MDDKYMQEMYSAILERTIKRLWILAIILIIALVGSNIAWVRYENSFADVVTTTQDVTQETDGGGDNTFIGGDYGKTESENNNN